MPVRTRSQRKRKRNPDKEEISDEELLRTQPPQKKQKTNNTKKTQNTKNSKNTYNRYNFNDFSSSSSSSSDDYTQRATYNYPIQSFQTQQNYSSDDEKEEEKKQEEYNSTDEEKDYIRKFQSYEASINDAYIPEYAMLSEIPIKRRVYEDDEDDDYKYYDEDEDDDIVMKQKKKTGRGHRKRRGRKRKIAQSHHKRNRNKLYKRRKKKKYNKNKLLKNIWTLKLFIDEKKQKSMNLYRHENWFEMDETDNIYNQANIGLMEHECPHCHALLFKNELRSAIERRYQFCCKRGLIKLPQKKPLPNFLYEYMTGTDAIAKQFQENIMKLNSTLRLSTSKLTRRQLPPGGPPKYILQGEVVHCTPNLNKIQNIYKGKFNQLEIYTYQHTQQADCRIKKLSFLSKIKDSVVLRYLLIQLQKFLVKNNWLVQKYITVYHDYINNPNLPVFSIKIHSNIKPGKSQDDHYKNYNAPTKKQIATIVPENSIDYKKPSHHSIIITNKKGYSRIIDERNALCDPLVFPLFHPYAESGYSADLTTTDGNKIDMTQYYRYQLQQRKNQFNVLFHGKTLFQQYVTNQWAKCQQSHMNGLRYKQKVKKNKNFFI